MKGIFQYYSLSKSSSEKQKCKSNKLFLAIVRYAMRTHFSELAI